jgi:hypothetical protein
MKKLTLEFEDLESWFTLGISCQLPDYKLLFRINKNLKVQFKRVESFQVNLPEFKGTFSLYAYYDSINEVECFLLSNHMNSKSLVSEYKQLDYFLLLRDRSESDLLLQYKDKIRKINEVIFTQAIDIEALKNHNILAEALEIHMEKIAYWRYSRPFV